MILLDTNVLSALMRLESEREVATWLATQHIDRLATSAPTIFEVRYGIELQPVGRRRRALEASFDLVMGSLLDHRVIPFDADAARYAAKVLDIRKRRGRTISIPDSQIAGLALAQSLPVATRDEVDFSDLGIQLINPWTIGV